MLFNTLLLSLHYLLTAPLSRATETLLPVQWAANQNLTSQWERTVVKPALTRGLCQNDERNLRSANKNWKAKTKILAAHSKLCLAKVKLKVKSTKNAVYLKTMLLFLLFSWLFFIFRVFFSSINVFFCSFSQKFRSFYLAHIWSHTVTDAFACWRYITTKLLWKWLV